MCIRDSCKEQPNMSTLKSTPRPGRHARRLFITLVIALLLAVTTGTAPAQEETDGPYPSDAEVYATLEPIVLEESRRGDVTTITLEVPVQHDTFTSSGFPNTCLLYTSRCV